MKVIPRRTPETSLAAVSEALVQMADGVVVLPAPVVGLDEGLR